MAAIPVEWYRGGPEMFAKADRQRRQMGALSALAGVPGAMANRYGEFQQKEDAASANEAELGARLNYAQQQTAAASPPTPAAPDALGAMDAMRSGMLAGVAPGGGSGSDQPLPITPAPAGETSTYTPGSVTEEKIGGRGELVASGQGQPPPDESTLARFARTAAGTLFGAYIPKSGQATRTGALKGQMENRLDRVNAMRAMSPLMRRATDPGKLWDKQLPEYATPPGTTFIPPAEKGAGAGQYSLGKQAQDAAQAKWEAEGHTGPVPPDRVLKERVAASPSLQPSSSSVDNTQGYEDPRNPDGPPIGLLDALKAMQDTGQTGMPPKKSSRSTQKQKAEGAPKPSSPPGPGAKADQRTGDIAARMKAILDANPPQ